jgi:hypothetical protein
MLVLALWMMAGLAQQTGGGGVPGASSGGSGTSAATKFVNGVGYSSNYTGSTLDVRVNACLADAETLSNGNTSGICDSSGEGGTQTIAAPIIVGTSGQANYTWKLPSSCNWTASGFPSNSTSAVITQHAGGSIIGQGLNWSQCTIYDTNNYIGAMYQTVEQAGYYHAEGFQLYNGGYTVAEGAQMVFNGSEDTSYFGNIGIINQTTAAAAILIRNATGVTCCSTVFDRIQANSNNQGGVVLDIEGTSAGEPEAINFTNSTFTHPATGYATIKCNDTATNKASNVIFTGTYIETGNTDTTTAPIQNTGCGQLSFFGLTLVDPYTASTATGITSSNAFATSLVVEGMKMYAGFPQAATAIVNSSTGETIKTDSYGQLTSYHSNGDYATQYNGLTLTPNTTGFSLGGGISAKTLTVANSMTLAGADGATYTLPGSSAALAPLASPVFTGSPTAPGFFPQSRSAGPYSVLFDDYYSWANNAANNIGTPTGASCAVNTTYTDSNHPGNILLTSGTGGSGSGITCGYQSENASVVAPNNAALGWTWETAVYVPVLPGTTAGGFQAGLTGGPNANPWTTGIQFYLSSANGVANDWYCRYGSTSIDSTIAAAAATWTRLTMANDGTYVHWYVNGAEATACKTVVGSMPSGSQYPASWSATALSGSSVTMSVDYVDFQRATAR